MGEESDVGVPAKERPLIEPPRDHATLSTDAAVPPAPPARAAGGKRRISALACVALALCMVLAAGTSVLLASQARPAVPARILNPNPDGLVLQSNATAYPTIAPIHATPIACPCGAPMRTTIPAPPGGAPTIGGRVILVSLSKQWLWAFSNRQLVYSTPVTTGRPELPTPTGIYSITQKIADTTFYSPWPPGSPFYYPPEHVNYAMLFLTGGYFIHDAPWRSDFGPGTNVPHIGPNGQPETGSHGCVEVPTSAGAWLFSWTPYSATVDIIG